MRATQNGHAGRDGSLVIRPSKCKDWDSQIGVKFHDRLGGDTVPFRVREAEVWGDFRVVHAEPPCPPDIDPDDYEPELILTMSVGAFGTYWEIECRNLWRFWRLHAVLALLPPGAVYRPREEPDDDDPEDCGAFTLQYWEETKHRVTTPAPIRQSGE